MSLATLPTAEVDRLKALHESGDRDALRAYIRALREQQWPLRAIGDPLGVSRSTVQYWEQTGQPAKDPKDTVVPLSPRAITTAGTKTVRWRSRLPEGVAEQLKYHADRAKMVRSQTPPNSPLRQSAKILDDMIALYLSHMVAVTEIAEAMGVTHRAVKARMERRNG